MGVVVFCFAVLFSCILKGTQSQSLFQFRDRSEEKFLKVWYANDRIYHERLGKFGFKIRSDIATDSNEISKHAALPNLVELAAQLHLTTLVDALKNTSLDNTVDHEGKFTLFAPTNEAFTHMPFYAKDETLKDMMKFHVARGMLYAKDLKNEMTDKTLLSKRVTRFNTYFGGKVITASGRRVISADHQAHNGVLHIISNVIASVYDIGGTILTEAGRSPEHKVLVSAVKKANMSSQLNGPGPYTLLSPLDRSIKKIPTDIINYLLKNVTALQEVILYHVIPGTLFSPGLVNEMKLKTLEGNPLTVSVQSGSIKVNNGTLISVDRTACNGAWHEIDTVLFPPSIKKLFMK